MNTKIAALLIAMLSTYFVYAIPVPSEQELTAWAKKYNIDDFMEKTGLIKKLVARGDTFPLEVYIHVLDACDQLKRSAKKPLEILEYRAMQTMVMPCIVRKFLNYSNNDLALLNVSVPGFYTDKCSDTMKEKDEEFMKHMGTFLGTLKACKSNSSEKETESTVQQLSSDLASALTLKN